MKNIGFTIVELMVAMSLFLIVLAVATGTFVETIQAQRTITSLMAANDNATQAIEQIAREIRTGAGFTTDGSILRFTNYNRDAISYKRVGNSVGRCVTNCFGDINFKLLTTPEVEVTRLKFILSGQEEDNLAARVTMSLSILGPKDIGVDLQTTVSSRILQ